MVVRKVSPENTKAPKLEAFPAYNEISNDTNKFPVLLQVTGPSLPKVKSLQTSSRVITLQPPKRVAVDVVAVLDISASMAERMGGLKLAMLELIKQLDWEMDRLCIVPFSEKTNCIGFLPMNDIGKHNAKSIIENLHAGGNTCCMENALKDAAKILKNRKQPSYRAGFILFLSASNYDWIDKGLLTDSFPTTYTIGLDDHNPEVLYAMAEKTRGTYSFIYKQMKDEKDIKDGILLLIRCLTSIVATDLRIVLRPQKGVTISSVQSGAYNAEVQPDSSVIIDIDNISAGETKKVTVFIDITKADEQWWPSSLKRLLPFGKSSKPVPILTVDGEYTDTTTKRTNKKQVSIDKARVMVVVKKLDQSEPDGDAICPQVDEELKRHELVRCVSELVSKPSEEKWIEESLNKSQVMTQHIFKLMQSVEDLDDDDKAKMINQPRPYLLSWLSSERWQRHTTKGEYSDNIKAPHPRLRHLPRVIVTLVAMIIFTLQGGPLPTQKPYMDMPPLVQDRVEYLFSNIVKSELCSAPMSRTTIEPKCTLHQIQYLLPFQCLAMIHSRAVGTCSAQLPAQYSYVISGLANECQREELRQQTPLLNKIEEWMLHQRNNKKVLKRMAVEVQAQLLLSNTGIAQLQASPAGWKTSPARLLLVAVRGLAGLVKRLVWFQPSAAEQGMGEIKDDLEILFKDMLRQSAHGRIIRPISEDMATTYTELGCLVAAY